MKNYKLFQTEKEVYDLYKENGEKVVIFKGMVYNIGDYINDHPGGADILEAELGKCIDEPFEEAEHT